MSESFAAALRDARASRHLSQSKLAEYAEFDHSYVSRLESGDRMPSGDAIDRLSEAMSLSEDERDRLLIAAGFLPDSAATLLSCPMLAELDRIHAKASEDDRAWIEQMAQMTLSRVRTERAKAA